MTDVIDDLTSWATANPWPTAAILGPAGALLLFALWRAGRALARRLRGRATVPVAMAAVGAVLATGLSSDTAWRFAADYLGIDAIWERALIFAIGEIALFTFGLAARANLHDPNKGSTGAPGMMVWVTCGVLAVPAIAVSDSVPAAVVRIVLGPCAAAVLWHMAMGIELRHTRPKAARMGMLAVAAAELRERTLARFGLSERTRTADQIIRERAAVKAAVLAERFHALKPTQARRRAWTLRRLQKQILKAGIATDPVQRAAMLSQRAHLQHAAGPRELPSPWEEAEVKSAVEDMAHTLVKDDPAAAFTRSPVNTASEVKTGQPGVKDTGLHPEGEEQGEDRGEGGVVHPAPAAQRQAGEDVHRQPDFTGRHGFHPEVHAGAEHGVFTPVFTTSPQVNPVKTGVNGQGEEAGRSPVNGHAGDMSIQQQSGSSPLPFTPGGEGHSGEDVHPQPRVNDHRATVPTQAAPVNVHPPVNADRAPLSGEDAHGEEPGKPSPEEARQIIEAAWWAGEKTNGETAQEARRAPSYVSRIWRELTDRHGQRPRAEQSASPR